MERETLKTETKVVHGISGQGMVNSVLWEIRKALGIQADNDEIKADLSNKRGISVVVKEIDDNHNPIEGAEVTKTILRDFDLNDPNVKQVLEGYLSMRGNTVLRDNYSGTAELNDVFSYIEENFRKRIDERERRRGGEIKHEFSEDGQTVTISSETLSSEGLIRNLPASLLTLKQLLEKDDKNPFPRKLKVKMYGGCVDIDLTVGGLCNTKEEIIKNLTNLTGYIQDAIDRNIFNMIIGNKKENIEELMAAQWRMCSKAIEPFFNQIEAQVDGMSDDIIKEPTEYVTCTHQTLDRGEKKYPALLLKPTIRDDDSFISASPKIQDVLRIYRATVLWKRKFEKEEREGKEHKDFKVDEKTECSGFGFKCFTTNAENKGEDQDYQYSTAWAPISVKGSAAFFEEVQREMRHIFIDDPQKYDTKVNGSLYYNVGSIENMMNDVGSAKKYKKYKRFSRTTPFFYNDP